MEPFFSSVVCLIEDSLYSSIAGQDTLPAMPSRLRGLLAIASFWLGG